MNCLSASTTLTRDLPLLIDEEIFVTVPIIKPAIEIATTSELTAVDFDPFVDGEILLTAPATESQQEIWLGVQISNEANLACLLSQTLRLTGQLNLDALQAAFDRLIDRHESLRTTFSGDGMTILIAKKIELTIPVIDLSALPDRERSIEIEQHQRQAVSQAFDLQHGPLFNAKIIKIDDREHLVILTVHHIICDGWSLGVIRSDLARIYNDLDRGIKPMLDPPAYFSEYAVLEQEKIDSLAAIEIEKYWVEKFENLPPVLELPTDYPRPPIRTFNSACENYTLTSSLVKAIEQVGIKHGCSLMTTLLAAFEVFLYKLTGETDLTVGVPTSGQIAADKYDLVGHCVNFLPMRARLDPECKFSDYLRFKNRDILDDYDRQNFTFGSLLKQLSIPRDASRIPLISAVFNVELNANNDKYLFDKLEVETVANRSSFATFEFFLNAAVAPIGEIDLDCQYNTNLFTAETIHRRLIEFENLLTNIVEHADRSIFKLSLLNVAQEHQLLVEWNNTHSEYPDDRCIHQLFEQQVERTPDAVAVVFEQQQITYRELNSRANQLAYHLKTLGVTPDVLVGICIERSIEMMVGLLGILKAGGAYLPLDPAYPTERLAYICSDSQIRILVTTQDLVALLPENRAKVVCLDTDWQDIVPANEENPVNKSTVEHLAYVIYTSGSTGNPKGVEIRHGAVTNFLSTMSVKPGLSERDILLAISTISFDIAALELYLPLMLGAKVILVSRQIAVDGIGLLQLLKASQATVMQATPATWQLLLAAGWEGKSQLKVLCGGEALSPKLANQILARVGSVWNMYGPTEATVWATTYEVNSLSQLDAQKSAISIGKPIGNTQMYILDRDLQPVPVGIRGELYIGGVCLARGYRNRPDLTAEKFIVNPFSTESNSRLYRTGDVVRYLPNGDIEYLSRIDNQVKIRGFRIELGEIEALLVKHPEVSEVAVIDREDRQGDRCLVAYLVAHPHKHLDDSTIATLSSRDLRAFLQAKLPEYMIPSAFVVLEALPMTPNGKVDLQALPTPDYSQQQSEHTLVAPRDELELQLTKIWERVLGVRPIGIRDNFFELGGHSLIAMRLFNEIEKALGKNILLSTLFKSQTIEELAAVFRAEESVKNWQSLVQMKTGNPTKAPLFCIHAIWGNTLFYRNFIQYLEADRPIYGLQSRGLDGKDSPCTSVPEMAAYYIQEIQSVQPQGPYLLLGFSLGGLIAFEIAQQLQFQGQDVKMLALIDPTNPNVTFQDDTRVIPYTSLFEKTRSHFRTLMKLNIKDGTTYVWERLQWNLTLGHINALYKIYVCYVKRSMSELRAMNVYWANYIAQYSYVPKPYLGQVTLFKAEDLGTIAEDDDSESSWRLLATGGVDVELVPGSHLDMMDEPNVKIMCAKFNMRLN